MKHDNIFGWSNMENQGQLLQLILDEMPPQEKYHMAEIGVYLGRGTAIFDEVFVSRGLDYKLVAIDHFEGSPEHKASNSIPLYEEALKNLEPIRDRVSLLNMESLDACKKFKDSAFDIVYIDASHEYEPVLQDIKAWLPKVKKGGFICGDDYVGGWPGVIQAVGEVFEGRHKVVPGTQQWYIRL